MVLRRAEKAGSWYPEDKSALQALLQECLQSDCESENLSPGRPVAAIVPHAGLSFSGPAAGKAFKAMSLFKPDTVLIFGAVHTMSLSKPALWYEGIWQTPLGEHEIDTELAESLLAAGICEPDFSPHYGDNAIELQMPFISFCFPKVKIVPIAVPALQGMEEVGSKTWQLIQNSGKKVSVFGSTDLTHYGDSFAFSPAGYGSEALAWARKNDKKLIDLMLALEADKIVNTALVDRSACGAGAAAATVALAKAAGAVGTLLEQTTSYEVMPRGRADNFVGYASIVYYEPYPKSG